MVVDPVPSDYPRVMPYLTVESAKEAIAFYVSVLGATERMLMPGPDGTVAHAEVQIGDSVVMLADTSSESGPSPRQFGGTPVGLMVYVPDVDATHQAALAAGAKSFMEPVDKFYGDRMSGFIDPFGHRWNIASHVEDVSPEEIDQRMKEMTDS